MRDLCLEVIPERAYRLLALVRLVGDVLLQGTSPFLDQLSELFIDCLLDGNLLGDDIGDPRLQPV